MPLQLQGWLSPKLHAPCPVQAPQTPAPVQVCVPHLAHGCAAGPQVTVWPQLFVAMPHTLPWQAATLSGVQAQTFAWQFCPDGQVEPHETCWLQLLVAVPQFLPAQGSFGAQHVPASQVALVQSVPLTQCLPFAHLVVQFGPPQSSSVSPLFVVLSMHVPPHAGQFTPPQSTPVSPLFG